MSSRVDASSGTSGTYSSASGLIANSSSVLNKMSVPISQSDRRATTQLREARSSSVLRDRILLDLEEPRRRAQPPAKPASLVAAGSCRDPNPVPLADLVSRPARRGWNCPNGKPESQRGPQSRWCSAEYELRVVAAARRLRGPGETNVLLRREDSTRRLFRIRRGSATVARLTRSSRRSADRSRRASIPLAGVSLSSSARNRNVVNASSRQRPPSTIQTKSRRSSARRWRRRTARRPEMEAGANLAGRTSGSAALSDHELSGPTVCCERNHGQCRRTCRRRTAIRELSGQGP